MCSVPEKPASDDSRQPACRALSLNSPHVSSRQRKEIALPRIVQLALEGHFGGAIAQKVGLPKRTVNYWLQELRQEWIRKAAAGTADVIALGVARLDAIYREAMEAWRDSQAEIQVPPIRSDFMRILACPQRPYMLHPKE